MIRSFAISWTGSHRAPPSIGATDQQRAYFRQYLHPGNNTIGTSFVDIGLDKELDDRELGKWLRMIAGEAMELWKLPCFEVPAKFPDLPGRVQNLWESGICDASEECVTRLASYPFNGLCGGIPPGFHNSPPAVEAGFSALGTHAASTW